MVEVKGIIMKNILFHFLISTFGIVKSLINVKGKSIKIKIIFLIKFKSVKLKNYKICLPILTIKVIPFDSIF